MKSGNVTRCILALAVFMAATVAVTAKEPSSATKTAFENLKKMAGEWTSADDADGKVSSIFEVVSGGSTVMERMMPGTVQEMITMYHLDGADLVLTHYCALGNQPHMKAEPVSDPKEVRFKCVGVSNADSEDEGHIHEAHFTFVDDDHVLAEWGHNEGGKCTHTAKFDLKRKK